MWTFQNNLCIQGLLSEVEVKYKMSECYLHMKEYREATTIVSEIKLISFFCNSSKENSFEKHGHVFLFQSLNAHCIGHHMFDCTGKQSLSSANLPTSVSYMSKTSDTSISHCFLSLRLSLFPSIFPKPALLFQWPK